MVSKGGGLFSMTVEDKVMGLVSYISATQYKREWEVEESPLSHSLST